MRNPHSPTHTHSNNKHSQNYSSSVSSSQTSSNPPSQSALHPHHTRPYPHPQKPSLHHASKPQARTGAVSATITSPPDSLQKCVFSTLPSFHHSSRGKLRTHTSRRPRNANCPSPRPQPGAAALQAARRTRAVSHSPTRSHSPISSRRLRRHRNHRPLPHTTVRSGRSHHHPRRHRR